ncbi:NAD-dependent epimerase/dehydratase family protein [Nocardia callitridis]|uniref:NAD-dependent epimerase/dehydratase domain-containing protein n=1 Tax=Nocardia callitridis TaxID=648753 RepID=A0ABP9K8K6_9NOCA
MIGQATALVLGGTGSVGTHVVAALRGGGYRVISVSRGPSKAGIDHVSLELATEDPRPLLELLRRFSPTLVVNAAGSYWGMDEPQMYRSLVTLTETTLVALAALPDLRARYVHLGSIMEYGPLPTSGQVDESAPTEPRSPYGRMKLAATTAVRASKELGAVDGIVLRVTNSLGPGVHHGTLIGKVGTALAAGRARIELSTLGGYRDFIDVRDLGDAVHAAARPPTVPDVVNIGYGQAVSVRQLVHRLAEISAVPVDIVETATASGALGASGASAPWLEVATDTAERTLGWRATRNVEQALHDYWLTFR